MVILIANNFVNLYGSVDCDYLKRKHVLQHASKCQIGASTNNYPEAGAGVLTDGSNSHNYNSRANNSI